MEFTKPFNLAAYFLDHNIEGGRGDKVAVQWIGGERTYQGVYEDSNRFARILKSLGVRREERVLMCLPNRYEFIPTWFGILKAGSVFTMVNPLLPTADYAHYLSYTQATLVVVDGDSLPKVLPHLEAAEHLLAVVVVGADRDAVLPEKCHRYESLMDDASAEHITVETGPDDIAGWLFTSGSTGHPKGAVHRHRDFAFNTENYAKQILGIREDDITLGVPKLFFGYATGTDLMFPFAVGASTVIFPGRSTPDTLFDHIERFKPTILTSVPTMIGKMERHERAESCDLTSLRMVLSAGEALPAELYERWKARTGVEILDGIGSAEMFHIYISNRPGDVKLGSLGKIVPGYRAEIVDDAGQALPLGQVGRLHISGGSTAIMYWADRAKSIETFQGEKCITADFFRQDEQGYFYYEGRASDLIKAGGIWVSPLEVENCLLTHESVAEVAVVGRADSEGLIKPCAYLVVKAGGKQSEQLCGEIQKHAKEHLAYYKYPRWVEFVESLPRNDRGKLDRKVVRAWALAK